ncbi:UPF0729 protein C18orf32 homolog [Styela clava]
MVCIPCIVIPFLLWVYHKYLQPFLYPIISKFWTPKSLESNSEKSGTTGMKCPVTGKTEESPHDKNSTEETRTIAAGGDKKTD